MQNTIHLIPAPGSAFDNALEVLEYFESGRYFTQKNSDGTVKPWVSKDDIPNGALVKISYLVCVGDWEHGSPTYEVDRTFSISFKHIAKPVMLAEYESD